MDRRNFIKAVGLSPLAAAVLAACGDDEGDEASGSTAGELTPAGGDPMATPAATLTPTTQASRLASTGHLDVVEAFLPASLDADEGSAGTTLLGMGVAEALMRYSPDLEPLPTIAEKLERLDDLTWEVTLRDDVTFWDGTAVDARAVKASFERALELLPSASAFIPEGSELTADGRVLTIKTPAPVGSMDHNLTSGALTVKKVATDGSLVYTGPFTVDAFTPRESMSLRAYEGYQGGPARLATVNARQVSDAAARVLALQAGDAQIAHALLPADVKPLESAGFQVFVAPWARQHMLILNTRAAPLDDVRVRMAYSLAIDREALRDGVMEGIGEPAYGFAPNDIGHAGILATQKYDPPAAEALLDDAGWTMGNDGFRARDGERLAFKIGTYSGRAELEQFAVVIKDQLKAVGVDLEIEKFQDVETALAENAFQSTTYSIGSAAFGDLSQLLATLYVPSSRNRDRYDNPEVTALYQQYVAASDAAERLELIRQIQELIGVDVPVIYLYNPYQIVAASKDVMGYTPHPLERDKYTLDMHLG